MLLKHLAASSVTGQLDQHHFAIKQCIISLRVWLKNHSFTFEKYLFVDIGQTNQSNVFRVVMQIKVRQSPTLFDGVLGIDVTTSLLDWNPGEDFLS